MVWNDDWTRMQTRTRGHETHPYLFVFFNQLAEKVEPLTLKAIYVLNKQILQFWGKHIYFYIEWLLVNNQGV